MKIVIPLVFSILLVVCKSPNANNNRSHGPRTDSVIIELNIGTFDSVIEYHNQFAIFYLPRLKVVQFCKTSSPHQQERKDLLAFINSNQKRNLVTNDSIMNELSASKKHPPLKDIMQWAIRDIVKTGQTKVYDKKQGRFVDYLKFYEMNGKYSGWIDIRFPNDSLIIHSLVWIQ